MTAKTLTFEERLALLTFFESSNIDVVDVRNFCDALLIKEDLKVFNEENNEVDSDAGSFTVKEYLEAELELNLDMPSDFVKMEFDYMSEICGLYMDPDSIPE